WQPWPIFKPRRTKVKKGLENFFTITAVNFYSGNSKDTVRSNDKGGIIRNKAIEIRRRRYKPIASMSESEQVACKQKMLFLAKRSEEKKEGDLRYRRVMNREKAKIKTEEEWQERRDYANDWKAAERDRQSNLVDNPRGAHEQRMIKI
ncbi:uncharacterized protein Bfra_005295, partial [Botrytis fragariae]